MLPILTEYFAFLLYLPILYAMMRLEGVRKEALQSLRFLVGFAAAIFGYLSILLDGFFSDFSGICPEWGIF